MIYEFNGLPGSGKSTLAYEIKNTLGITDTRRSTFDKIKHHLFLSPIEMYYIFCISRGANGKLTKQDINRVIYTELICSSYRLFKRANRMVDQGIVQSIASIFYQVDVSIINWEGIDKYIIRLLQRYNKKIVLINADIDPRNACMRIRSRSSGEGPRYDKIQNDSELIGALEKQHYVLKHIRQLVSDNLDIICIDLNMKKSISQNADIVKSKLPVIY